MCCFVDKGEAGKCIFKARRCQRGADETWIFKRKGKCNSEHVQMPGMLPLRPRSCIQIKTKFQMPSTKAQTVVRLDCTDCRIVTSSVYAARRAVFDPAKTPQKLSTQLFTVCCLVPCERGRVQQGTPTKKNKTFYLIWYLERRSVNNLCISPFVEPQLRYFVLKQKPCFGHF